MSNKIRDIPANSEEMVTVGHVYKNRDDDVEVIPFHVDFANSMVSFAPVGRASEGKLLSKDFLKQFVYFGEVSSMAEKQTPNKRPASDAK